MKLKLQIVLIINQFIIYIACFNEIGDWGLGIGPNPQSPIPISKLLIIILKSN